MVIIGINRNHSSAGEPCQNTRGRQCLTDDRSELLKRGEGVISAMHHHGLVALSGALSLPKVLLLIVFR